MGTQTRELPAHLARFVVPQDYDRYTARDQAVWRHIIRGLKSHLEARAHPVYLRGLDAVGISSEEIPRIEEMNEKLARVGWACVAVRGFVPPAVFTELQCLRVLGIACDIRGHRSLNYTPAPDIIHESAGHAPILADATYAAYLQAVGEVGFKTIESAEDRAVFEAIRNLSVVKEDPGATSGDSAHAELQLAAATRSVRYVSEATRASRLYWWTAEYGLVGTIDQPRLYGAGLLSSLGEAEHCLTPEVRKVPLDVGCAEVDFDITTMQPQLFVARDFAHLMQVLQEFRSTLAWSQGGDAGIAEALRARSVVHTDLGTAGEESFQLTGAVTSIHRAGTVTGRNLTAAAVVFGGYTMVSKDGVCTEKPKRVDAVVLVGDARLPARGAFAIKLSSEVEASGFVIDGHEVVDFRASYQGRPLGVQPWARVLVAREIRAVAGGPADPRAWDEAFGKLDSFQAGSREDEARAHKAEELPPELAALYAEVLAATKVLRPSRDSLYALERKAAAFPDEVLLQGELSRLVGQSGLSGRR